MSGSSISRSATAGSNTGVGACRLRVARPNRSSGRVVESIPGLRGFVGVDFLWDEARRQATVLEINPRPTTSCVGLTRLLPPGQLADAWLVAFEEPVGDAELLSGLADRVHGQQTSVVRRLGRRGFDRGVV